MGLVSKLHFFENVAPQKLLELEKDAKLKRYGASERLSPISVRSIAMQSAVTAI
ncbi:MAG: hypothetical protein PHI89_03320 [Thiovulaceae bacterium]|nr:hypothetical protein [Sulfurimonadaceae bacterium]